MCAQARCIYLNMTILYYSTICYDIIIVMYILYDIMCVGMCVRCVHDIVLLICTRPFTRTKLITGSDEKKTERFTFFRRPTGIKRVSPGAGSAVFRRFRVVPRFFFFFLLWRRYQKIDHSSIIVLFKTRH